MIEQQIVGMEYELVHGVMLNSPQDHVLLAFPIMLYN